MSSAPSSRRVVSVPSSSASSVSSATGARLPSSSTGRAQAALDAEQRLRAQLEKDLAATQRRLEAAEGARHRDQDARAAARSARNHVTQAVAVTGPPRRSQRRDQHQQREDRPSVQVHGDRMRLQQGCRSDPDPHERRGTPAGNSWSGVICMSRSARSARTQTRTPERSSVSNAAGTTHERRRPTITAPSPAPYASACPHERSPSPHKSRTARFGQSTTATSKANLTPEISDGSPRTDAPARVGHARAPRAPER